MPIVIYISHRCSNCVRLLNTIKRIPSLQAARIIDIDRGPVQGIEHVPTLVDQRGRRHVGGKAFEFLKQYEDEIDIQPLQLGSGSLPYGSIQDGGELQYTNDLYEFK